MKEYFDVKHISASSSKQFEKELRNVIMTYQERGLEVEVQHATMGSVFSAVVLGYKEHKKGMI